MSLLPAAKGLLVSSLRRAALSGCCSPPRPAPERPSVCFSIGMHWGGLKGNIKGRISASSFGSRPACMPFILSGAREDLWSGGPANHTAQRGFAISPLNPHIHRGVLYPRVPQPYVLVVLLRTVPGVGAAGEVRYVRRGFFRHSLGRKGWALPATWQNIDLVHNRIQQLKRQQQQQPQQQRQSTSVPEKQRDGFVGEVAEATTSPIATAGGPGSELPADDEGLTVSWVRRLRLRYVVETEVTDSTQLLEPLTPQQVLQRLSEEEGLDLLPDQLRLVRRRLLPPTSTKAQPQQQQADWPEELLQGRPLAGITRVGEYDIVAVLPTKSRPIARTFCVEVVSQAHISRALEAQEREKGDEGESHATFALPSLH